MSKFLTCRQHTDWAAQLISVSNTAIVSLIFLLTSSPVMAGFMLQPVNVTSSVATNSNSFPIDFLINQNGLSPGYTSKITDFDAYIAQNPTHNTRDNGWFAILSVPAGQLTFNLGGLNPIESLVIWNCGVAGVGIKDFSILASNDSTFSTSVNLGSFTAISPLGTNTATLPQVFSFAPISASFIRLDIQNVQGGPFGTISMGQVAFELVAVPEPSSFLMVVVSGMIANRFRRRKHWFSGSAYKRIVV